MRPATWDSRLPGSRKGTESPRALLALVWRTLREDAAGRPVRLAVALWFVVQLAIVLVVVWDWTGAGVDGILSQRATPDGFVITQVRPGAAIDLAGLQPGDRIVARDGGPATDRQAYWGMRRVGQAEQPVVLSIVRRDAAPGAAPEDVHMT